MAFSMNASKKSGREVVLDPILASAVLLSGSVQKEILSYDSSGFEPRRLLGETIVGHSASNRKKPCRLRLLLRLLYLREKLPEFGCGLELGNWIQIFKRAG